MPMWCTSTDTPTGSRGIPQPHHRIVRIPPGESVVLNSAERAPYLLLIEILHDDLDFDPVKRNNKEILKKIVLKEVEKEDEDEPLQRQALISKRCRPAGGCRAWREVTPILEARSHLPSLLHARLGCVTRNRSERQAKAY